MTDYELEFRRCRDACGEAFPEFVQFFKEHSRPGATVPDLGCGQGLDALVAAAHGRSVLGVDASPTGVSQMQQLALAGGLPVEGVVADVLEYTPKRKYSVVVLDRVLHMLPGNQERTAVLRKASQAARRTGHVLVADTPKQAALVKSFFQGAGWTVSVPRRGFVFAQQTSRTHGERRRRTTRR